TTGKSLVFITHKLREVLAIADRVTVLRGGRVVGELPTAGATEQELATLMVGRSVALYGRIAIRPYDTSGDRAQEAADAAALALRARHPAAARGGARPGPPADPRLRHPRARAGHADGDPVGRQPAEGNCRARALAADPPAGGRPADPRARRRLDRVHPRTAGG